MRTMPRRATYVRKTSKALSLLGLAPLVLCDSGGPTDLPPKPTRTVEFHKVLERDVSEVTGFPSGVAVTPDGRWLISLGFSRGTVTVYDATTLEPVAGPVGAIDSVEIGQPHAVVVSPDGSLAVLTGALGVVGASIPSLELLFLVPNAILSTPRYVVRDRAGENYYVSGEGDGIARVTAIGEVAGLVTGLGNIITGIALTRDEEDLLVLTDNGSRLVVLTIPDLNQRLSVDLPFPGQALVPLKENGRAIIAGGRASVITGVHLPLMAGQVELITGSVGSVQVLLDATGGFVDFGDGNEWAYVGESTAVLNTGVGAVTIDTSNGAVTFHEDPFLDRVDETPPCCDIASYPGGDRIVVAHPDFADGSGGSLIVYDVEEMVVQ